MPTIHVVSHTHWDREWYHLAGRFRQSLVALVDELLDDPPGDGASFLLDGQTAVIDDYLAVRPERAAELGALLRSGAVEAGPWFVLADELIPGGEALVRNLLAGARDLRALRAAAPPVLYCPDSFGHPAALPAIARGFGLEVIVLWRGYGSRRWPAGDAAWWRSPDGARALLYHLPPSGYEFGAELPAAAEDAAARWRSVRDVLESRSRLDVALLPNGADHHARQRRLPEAVSALAAAAAPTPVVASSLGAFAYAALDGAGAAPLPDVQGELRDSYGYTWTLQGTFATRAHQKRRAAALERALVREVKPWAALAARAAGSSRAPLVRAAWRELLLCHPHDTLCGCSVDGVARAMDARLDDACAQARGLRDDALAALVGHDVEAAGRANGGWRPHLIVRNPAPRPRGGVAIVSLSRFVADVRVGPGSGAPVVAPPARPRRKALGVEGVEGIQILERYEAHERVESPRAYPDDDLVERVSAAVWVPAVPGYGMRPFPVVERRVAAPAPRPPVEVGVDTLSNGRYAVRLSAAGQVALTHIPTGRRVDDLIALEDQDDAGDLYTPSPRGEVRHAHYLGARLVHRGPLRGAVECRYRLHVRSGAYATARVRFMLDADADFLRIAVHGENAAPDHRLRVRLATGVRLPEVRADAAFGPVMRVPIAQAVDELAMETAPPTAPLRRYVTLSGAAGGATLFSDGLAEYEADGGGGIRVTLLRAVGELSRNDIPERPGHAGWPAATPEAQCMGAFGGEFALMLHDAWSDETAGLVERTADDVLLPLAGETVRSLRGTPPGVDGVELEGPGLTFSAAKESEDGEWMVLRCVNVTDRVAVGRWRVAGGVREARLARLDETPGAALAVTGDLVECEAPPLGILTILVR